MDHVILFFFQLLGLNGQNAWDLAFLPDDEFVPSNTAAKGLNMKNKTVPMRMTRVFKNLMIICPIVSNF